MLETFTEAGSRDFRQRYSGSFGYYTVPESRKRILVQMETINETIAGFRDARNALYEARSDTGVEFEFIPVTKTLIIQNGVLAYIRRRPARQWARGVNTANTQLTAVLTGVEMRLTFDAIIAAFASDPPDYSLNVTALERKEVNAILLSPRFGVEGSVLYLYDMVIGSFMADRREIIVEELMFKQEVEDLVAQLGLRYTITDKVEEKK
jgi:hypothetical protein